MPEAKFRQEGNTYSVSGLPQYADDGREIVYSAKEKYMDGYVTMYLNKGKYENRTRAVYNRGTILNREYTGFSIRKVWIGVTDDKPEIVFDLYQDGKLIEWRQPEPTADGMYSWEYLPKLRDGEEAEYYVIERPVPGYAVKYENIGSYRTVTDRCYAGGKIINYQIPKTGDGGKLEMGITCVVMGLLLIILFRRRHYEI